MVFRLGKLRSGRPLDVPLFLPCNGVNDFLAQFREQELVDVLCLTQYYLVAVTREEKNGGAIASSILISEALLQKRQEHRFEGLLEEHKLLTSLACVRFAKSLQA